MGTYLWVNQKCPEIHENEQEECVSLSVGRCHSFIITWDRFVPFSDWPQKLLICPHSGKTKWQLLVLHIKNKEIGTFVSKISFLNL